MDRTNYNSHIFHIPGFIKETSECWDWMETQEKKYMESGMWMWDDDDVAPFVIEDLRNDGMMEADIAFALWLAMRMKFLREPFLSFTQTYFATKKRNYTEELCGYQMIEWMRMSSSPYLLGILNGDKVSYGDIYPDPSRCWEYGKAFAKTGSLKYIILNDDQETYRDMTTEEQYIEKNSRHLTIDEKRSLETMNRERFHEIFPAWKIEFDKRKEMQRNIEWENIIRQEKEFSK